MDLGWPEWLVAAAAATDLAQENVPDHPMVQRQQRAREVVARWRIFDRPFLADAITHGDESVSPAAVAEVDGVGRQTIALADLLVEAVVRVAALPARQRVPPELIAAAVETRAEIRNWWRLRLGRVRLPGHREHHGHTRGNPSALMGGLSDLSTAIPVALERAGVAADEYLDERLVRAARLANELERAMALSYAPPGSIEVRIARDTLKVLFVSRLNEFVNTARLALIRHPDRWSHYDLSNLRARRRRRGPDRVRQPADEVGSASRPAAPPAEESAPQIVADARHRSEAATAPSVLMVRAAEVCDLLKAAGSVDMATVDRKMGGPHGTEFFRAVCPALLSAAGYSVTTVSSEIGLMWRAMDERP